VQRSGTVVARCTVFETVFVLCWIGPRYLYLLVELERKPVVLRSVDLGNRKYHQKHRRSHRPRPTGRTHGADSLTPLTEVRRSGCVKSTSQNLSMPRAYGTSTFRPKATGRNASVRPLPSGRVCAKLYLQPSTEIRSSRCPFFPRPRQPS